MSALVLLCAVTMAAEPGTVPTAAKPAAETLAADGVTPVEGSAVDGADVSQVPDPEPYPIRFEGQCRTGDPHFDLEVLYYENRYAEGLELAEAGLRANPDDPVLHWMKVRFMFEIGEGFGPDTTVDKVAFYKQMVTTADEGIELDPKEPHLRFGRGVAMGRLGTTRGVLASLFMAKDVEADWLAVANNPTWRYSSIDGAEMLPCDAFHALGIFYRLVPDWWIVQVLAGTRGDLTQSLAFHRKAVACKPRDIKNWKELAATQFCIGTKDKDDAMIQAGNTSVDRGLAIRATGPKDRVDHQHLRMLRDDPSLACGYSRDGQQDLDEKKLDK